LPDRTSASLADWLQAHPSIEILTRDRSTIYAEGAARGVPWAVADMHRTLQIAFGWSDEHLHRFVIHGRLYGADNRFDSRRVRLGDLCLRLRERLLYEYL
jgi:hypothetical protein